MEQIFKRKITLWIILSINLLIAFFIGLIFFTIDITIGLTLGFTAIPALIILIYFILNFLKAESINQIKKKKISIWLMLAINLLFSFIIGATIPLMEIEMWIRYNMAYVMIPLLIILNYIIIDRFHYYIRHANDAENSKDESALEIEEKKEKEDSPVIEFEGKKFIFTVRSIILLAIGAPVLSYLIYLFFDTHANYWLHEIVVKQTVFFLNLLFDMNAKAVYSPTGKYYWSFDIPDRGTIYFETFCTGIQAICVFAGIIICTPHSQDQQTKEDIIWRKTKSLIISSIIFYVVNIIRMIIQLYLYWIGYAWVDIHYSISAASSFIAAIIVLLMHKWIPEFIISIIYSGTLVSRRIKESKEDNS
ncbi:MAG: archaeosortase H [Promethearchaeota archaeon]